MVVYIEYVILDNFSVTFLLAVATYRLVHKHVRYIRALLASVAGTAAAVFYPFVSHAAVLLAFKLGVWVVLSVLLFARLSRPLCSAVLFLAATFLFGGLLTALGLAATGDILSALCYGLGDYPVGLLVLGAATAFKGLQLLGMRLHRVKDISGLMYGCRISLFGRVIELSGLMDTGNRLYDKMSGLPVVIVSAKCLTQCMDDGRFTWLLSGQGERLQRGARYMNYGTLSSKKNRILLVKPDSFQLYSGDCPHIYDVMVGITFESISAEVDYDAILHPALL